MNAMAGDEPAAGRQESGLRQGFGKPSCYERLPVMIKDRYLAIRVVMMPRDTNPQGTIFGGVLLSYIDQAGAVGARHELARQGYPEKAMVTVAMASVEFHNPVFVGDTVSFWTELRRIGTTSITMHVTVETDRQGVVANLTEADVTYVAVRTDGQRRVPVPLRETPTEPPAGKQG